MARRTEPLPAFPKELTNLGWTLIKVPGINAVRAINGRLHCMSPNFARDGRDWARRHKQTDGPPQVRKEIVDWARRIMGIATPLIAALDRAVPHSAESPRPSLFWSVASTGPERGGLIEVSAGFNRWALLPQANGWLLFPPPPPREMPALPIPEQVLSTVWIMLAAHDQHVRARGAGTTSAEDRRLFLRIQALVRAWVLAHDPELATVMYHAPKDDGFLSQRPMPT